MMRLVAGLLLALGFTTTSLAADARLAWKDYAWLERPFFECTDVTADGACHAFRQKWDWKRNQWVDFSYSVDAARGEIAIRLVLTNNSPKDDDNVCVTALFIDDAGQALFAYHQNWHSDPGTVLDKTHTYKISQAMWRQTTRVVAGSKQCRNGPHQDDALFESVKAATGQ